MSIIFKNHCTNINTKILEAQKHKGIQIKLFKLNN